MNRNVIRTVIGLGMITLGVLFLLQSFEVVQTGFSLIWAVLFAAGGVTFLYFYYLNREQWWAVIPGFAMLGIGAVIAVAEYGPARLGESAGAIFLFSIGLSFLFVFLRNREMWWALIPMGFCMTLTLIVISDTIFGVSEISGAIFFLGGAMTFGLVGILPTRVGNLTWAFIPAIVMLGIGALILAAVYEAFQVFGAGALVLLGLFLLARSLMQRERA